MRGSSVSSSGLIDIQVGAGLTHADWCAETDREDGTGRAG